MAANLYIVPRAGRKLTATWDHLEDARDAIAARQEELRSLSNKRATRGNAGAMGILHDDEEFLRELDGILQAAHATARQAAPSVFNRLLASPDGCPAEVPV